MNPFPVCAARLLLKQLDELFFDFDEHFIQPHKWSSVVC
jgi:hypothetical protein